MKQETLNSNSLLYPNIIREYDEISKFDNEKQLMNKHEIEYDNEGDERQKREELIVDNGDFNKLLGVVEGEFEIQGKI